MATDTTSAPIGVGKVICELSLESLLQRKSLDISECATPGRYRLINCADFIDNKKLTLYEYTDFPKDPFAAVSYVWRGNTPEKDFDHGHVFNVPIPQVEGIEPGDPIGIDVLHEACVASIASGATHLWLDRLSIMQMSKEDKKWQIGQMYKIYQRCHVCIVTPGGIQCLVPLDRETQWIHRGWTLQEAVAPSRVVVLFSWKLGTCTTYAGDMEGVIEEVIPSKSAMAPLSLIVDASTTGSLSINHGEEGRRLLLHVKLFSSHSTVNHDLPSWRQTSRTVMSPNVGAIARIMSSDLDQDVKEYSIWQSALMRTSSRPVDMIFSIMGLFGITLDTSKFGENDRVAATIALARAIMDNGGRATWLAAAFRISPSRQISTFPVFPRTSVSGKAFVRVAGGLQEVSSMMTNEYPVAQVLVPMPIGAMDSEGYLRFTAKSIGVQLLSEKPAAAFCDPQQPNHIQAVDGSWWEIIQESSSADNVESAQYFAVLIGYFVGYYPGGTPAHDTKNIRAMIIEKHAEDSFHVRSYIMLSRNAKRWVQGWRECNFSIGGPEKDFVEDVEEDLPIVLSSTEQYLNSPNNGGGREGAPSLEDRVIRRARWAVPQEALEREYGK